MLNNLFNMKRLGRIEYLSYVSLLGSIVLITLFTSAHFFNNIGKTVEIPTIIIGYLLLVWLNIRRIHDFEGSTLCYWFCCVAIVLWPVSIFLLSIQKGMDGINKFGLRTEIQKKYFTLLLPLTPISYGLLYMIGWIPN